MDIFYHFCFFLLAQTQTAPADGGDAAGAAQEAAKDPGLFGGFGGMMIPIMLGVMLLYVLMSAKQPNQANAAGKSDLLANLKKNDKVVTAGGILGTVVNYRSDSEYVTLRVDDATNARMQVLATSIYRVVSDDDTKKES